MRSFVLIDLWSQAAYLPAEIRAWPLERFLRWLELFGEVERIEIPFPGPPSFCFRSAVGLHTTFRYSDEGRFVLAGDHFVVGVW